ncbi:MAG: hypothetical protein R2795_04890 [Saprospiraceae bacterium]
MKKVGQNALLGLLLLWSGMVIHAAQTTLVGNELYIALDAANEAVDVANDGTQITLTSSVGITGAGATFTTAQVVVIIISDAVDEDGQSIRFVAGSDFVLAGLTSTGVEKVEFINSVNATAGGLGIQITAPQNIILNGSTLNGGTGGVQLSGQGMAALETYGIFMRNNATVTANGMGAVSMYGNGGAAGVNNQGVLIRDNSVVSSSGGDVTVTGVSSINDGVILVFGGQITAGGMGNVTVDGTAAPFTTGTVGGVIVSNENSRITSSGGNVVVMGRVQDVPSTKPNNYGVYLQQQGVISAGGLGTVTVIGHGGTSTGYGNDGVVLFEGTITSSGGKCR